MKSFRLEKRRILKSRTEFNEIFRTGTKVNSKHFLFLVKNSDESKFGFTVSRNIKGSVRRNRAKRRLREILRLNQSFLPPKKHIVFQAKPGVEHQKIKALNDEFIELLKQLNQTD